MYRVSALYLAECFNLLSQLIHNFKRVCLSFLHLLSHNLSVFQFSTNIPLKGVH